jgi:hypothetical protein
MNVKQIIYLAGPMRGIPELNFPAFYAAEARWKNAGWDVINPAQMDKEHGFVPTATQTHFENLSIEQALARDLPAVSSANAIAMMVGWERSQGANMELRHALEQGKLVYDAATLLPVDWKPVI